MSLSGAPIRVALSCLVVLLPFSCYLLILLIRHQPSTRSSAPRRVFPLTLYLVGCASVAISAILGLSATHHAPEQVAGRVFEVCGRSMATVATILLLQSIFLYRPLHDPSSTRESFLPRFASTVTLNESNPTPPPPVSYLVSLIPLFGSLLAILRILGEVVPSLDRIPVLLDPILQICVSLGALLYILVLFQPFRRNTGLSILVVGQILSLASYSIDIANTRFGFPRGSSTSLECARLFCVFVWFLSNLLLVFLIYRYNSFLEYLSVSSKQPNGGNLASSRTTFATASTSIAQLLGQRSVRDICHDSTIGPSHSHNTIHNPSSSTIREIVSDARHISYDDSSPDIRTSHNRNSALAHPFGLHLTTPSCRYVVADNTGTLVKTSTLPPTDDFLSMLDGDPFASAPPSPAASFTLAPQFPTTRSYVPCPLSPPQRVMKSQSSSTSVSPTAHGRPTMGCAPKHSESYSPVLESKGSSSAASKTINCGRGAPLRRTISDSVVMRNGRLGPAAGTGRKPMRWRHKANKSSGGDHVRGGRTDDVLFLASLVQNALDTPNFLPVSDTRSLSTKHGEEEDNVGLERGRMNPETRARSLGLGLPILAPTQSSASSEITTTELKAGSKDRPRLLRSFSSDRYNFRTHHPSSSFRSKFSDTTPPLSRPLSMIFDGLPSPTTASPSTPQKSLKYRYSHMGEPSTPSPVRTERFATKTAGLLSSTLLLEGPSTASAPLGQGPPSAGPLAHRDETAGAVAAPLPTSPRQIPTPTKRRPAAINVERIKVFERAFSARRDSSSDRMPTISRRASEHSAISGRLKQLVGQVGASNTGAVTSRSSTTSMQRTASSPRSGSVSTLTSSAVTKSFSIRRASSAIPRHPAAVSVEAFGPSMEEPSTASGISSYGLPEQSASNWTGEDRKTCLAPSEQTFLSFESSGSSGSPRHQATSLEGGSAAPRSPPESNSHENAGIGLNLALPESLFGGSTFSSQSHSSNIPQPASSPRHALPQLVHVGEHSPTQSTYFTASPTPATPFSAFESSVSSTPSSPAIPTPQTAFFASDVPYPIPSFGRASSSLMNDLRTPAAWTSLTSPVGLGERPNTPSRVRNQSAEDGGKSRFSLFGFESSKPKMSQARRVSTPPKSQPRRLNTSHSAHSDLAFEMQEFRVLSPDGEDRSFRREFGLRNSADLEAGQTSTRRQGLDLDFDFEELGLRF